MAIFRGETGTCKGCNRKEVWVVVKFHYLCRYCNEKRKKLEKLKRKRVDKPVAQVKPKEGMTKMQFFNAVWAVRPHFSEISGKALPKFNIWCFAHILSVGSHKQFEFKSENICLMTPAEHDLFDNRGGVEELAKTHDGWRKLLERKAKLKRKYNDKI